ncbi:MAG TPA: hypothetical protein VGK75_21020 [Casimicrobiaceae bacterium]|jgi:hypothetical protein
MHPLTICSHSTLTACVIALVGIAGCASAPVGAPIDAPRLVVGDHWQYRITDNLRRGTVSQLDAEVIAVAGGSARIRLDYVDTSGRTEWIDEVDGQGGLRSGALWREPPRPFNPPAQLLAFPLDQGKTWRQVIDTLRKDTELNDQILIYGKVDGRNATTVPAGGYDAVYVYRIVQLDDEEFWRTRTTLRDAVWYAPEVKAPVREAREAEYTEKGGGPDMTTIRTESTVLELVSFRPGK